MSRKCCGADYTCNLCDKVCHTNGSRPNNWALIEAKTVDGISGMWTLHACDDCWPKPKSEIPKKNLITRFKLFLKGTP